MPYLNSAWRVFISGTSVRLAVVAHEQKAHGVQLIGVVNLVCDARGLCQTIRSKIKQVFRLFRCAYESLRCLDLEIW